MPFSMNRVVAFLQDTRHLRAQSTVLDCCTKIKRRCLSCVRYNIDSQDFFRGTGDIVVNRYWSELPRQKTLTIEYLDKVVKLCLIWVHTHEYVSMIGPTFKVQPDNFLNT